MPPTHKNFWIKEIRTHSIAAKHILIIGNQNDLLRKNKETIDDTELRRICHGYKTSVAHMSAKLDSMQHCQDVIDDFCREVLMHKFELAGPLQSSSSSSNLDITAADPNGFHIVKLDQN